MAQPTNIALYRLLVRGGATEAEAEAAARLDASELATKADIADLRTEIKALKAELLQWTVGIIFTALGIQTALLIFVLTHYVKP